MGFGKTDGELDKNITALNDKVVLKKFEVFHELKRGGIFIPSTTDVNFRMNRGTVLSIGPEAVKELNGLEIGDDVLYDHFGACADTHPNVIVPAKNIICKVEGEEKQ